MHLQPRTIQRPTAFVCPDCGGAMARLDNASGLLDYVCHTGHRVTGQILAAHQLHDIERHLEITLRLLNEAAALAVDFQAAAFARDDASRVSSWRSAELRLRELQDRVLALGVELPGPVEIESSDDA